MKSNWTTFFLGGGCWCFGHFVWIITSAKLWQEIKHPNLPCFATKIGEGRSARTELITLARECTNKDPSCLLHLDSHDFSCILCLYCVVNKYIYIHVYSHKYRCSHVKDASPLKFVIALPHVARHSATGTCVHMRLSGVCMHTWSHLYCISSNIDQYKVRFVFYLAPECRAAAHLRPWPWNPKVQSHNFHKNRPLQWHRSAPFYWPKASLLEASNLQFLAVILGSIPSFIGRTWAEAPLGPSTWKPWMKKEFLRWRPACQMTLWFLSYGTVKFDEVRGLWTVKGERVMVYPKRIWHQTSCNIHQTARKWMSGLQRGGGCVDRCFLANANEQPTRVSIYLPFFLQYLHLVECLRIPQTFRNGLPLKNWGWESCTRDLFQTFWRAGRCLLFGLRFWCLWDWSLIGLVCYTSIQILHLASNFTLSALLVQFFKGKILKRFVTRL